MHIGYFLLGMAMGAMATLLAITLYMRHLVNEAKTKLTSGFGGKSIDSKEQFEDIKEKLARVKEITTKQLELQSSVGGPQKNAMDGKHQNFVIAELKRMEQEKGEILQSIIKDGYNPSITIMDGNGDLEEMSLSEYLGLMDFDTEPEKPTGKFTVIRGGKSDDDGGETTH